jgi:hypothetical protein
MCVSASNGWCLPLMELPARESQTIAHHRRTSLTQHSTNARLNIDLSTSRHRRCLVLSKAWSFRRSVVYVYGRVYGVHLTFVGWLVCMSNRPTVTPTRHIHTQRAHDKRVHIEVEAPSWSSIRWVSSFHKVLATPVVAHDTPSLVLCATHMHRFSHPRPCP